MEKFIKHNHREDELHDGFGSLGEILVVKGEPPEVLQPGEGALHDPPLGQHVEPGRDPRPVQDRALWRTNGFPATQETAKKKYPQHSYSPKFLGAAVIVIDILIVKVELLQNLLRGKAGYDAPSTGIQHHISPSATTANATGRSSIAVTANFKYVSLGSLRITFL